ncbi:hypothetical protein CY34DRAFT_92415 [Suillus luteus UH-Slu-Lm8-n1]|uniref:Uncharacterized protein n=1 Tax=Suillus luteus UH-Slu-Lm8-n1 TaxID=930992 RepID=A0A0D0B0N6_9AGAM|nr:hypothetical protein CY34DRAFT_92415 [Suillus luteus UH-Slu-Lm8-n1]
MRVYLSVVLIPLFGIDVPASSKGIRLSTKFPGTETNEEIEMVEDLGPASLATRQEFGGGEVLKVLVICDDVNGLGRAFEVVLPGPESFVDGEKFIIVCVIIELRSGQHLGVECDWTELRVWTYNGKYSGNGIVGGISFYDNRNIRHPMRFPAILREVPRNILAGKLGEGDDNIRVVEDEPAIEISESKEGLNILDFPGFRPVNDGLDFPG